ncbi:uncharacterized protein UDID_17648 [Ustilago sp. UG-2017a]|nr:uncharacterized protein UDID_17648 [Ustilago sp. UG-2017a]
MAECRLDRCSEHGCCCSWLPRVDRLTLRSVARPTTALPSHYGCRLCDSSRVEKVLRGSPSDSLYAKLSDRSQETGYIASTVSLRKAPSSRFGERMTLSVKDLCTVRLTALKLVSRTHNRLKPLERLSGMLHRVDRVDRVLTTSTSQTRKRARNVP